MATPIHSDVIRSRPVPQPPRSTQGGRSDGLESEREREGARRTTRPGTLSTALSMQDDLSALVSSLQRRRDSQGQAATHESAVWIEHVLDDGVHEKLAQLEQVLPGMKGAAELLAVLRVLFADSSDATAALRALLAQEKWLKLRVLLEQALEQLLAEHEGQGIAAQLRGGLNVAVKARLAARQGALNAVQLRHSYRDFLAAGDAGIEQYAHWIEHYGFLQRGQVLDFMEQAIAADMYALDPSGGQLEFGTLLRRVRLLSTVRSVDLLLIEHCTRLRLLESLQVSAQDVVTTLLDVVRGLQAWDALFNGAFAGARVALARRQRAQWIQALLRAVQGLPDAAWMDDGARTLAQSTLQMLADADVADAILHARAQCGGLA